MEVSRIGPLHAERRHLTRAHLANNQLPLLAIPIHVGDLVELVARVESVGRTSMRVRVEVNREHPYDGSRELCTVGHFTLVAVDADGKPTTVPPE